MNRHRVRAWFWFAVTAIPLLLVLSWLTAMLVDLDRDELQARRQGQLHEKLRLALWRMDSWLLPQLSREAMRPAADYQPFGPAPTAWTRSYSKIDANEVIVQSPLLGVEDPLFSLHFEVHADGTLLSPQVPTGNQRDVCEANGVDSQRLERASARLESLRPALVHSVLEQRIGGAESLLSMVGCNPVAPDAAAQTQQSVAEFNNRQLANAVNLNQGRAQSPGPIGQWAATAAAASTGIGPLVPLWIEGPDQPLLLIARRIRDVSGVRYQGAVLDWQALQRELLNLVTDLFAAGCAEVVRCESTASSDQVSMLATVPARLVACGPESTLAGLPMTTILGVTWGVVLLALLVLGFTLRTAIGFGERRARFASAVTHELRTPLTTFRMYSEMLADGVVTDPKAKQEYLTTLQRESDRLSRVVENVLAWSRLEEGRFASRRERHGVAALVDRLLPLLHRRLQDAGMELVVRVDDRARDAVLLTDEDAIGQILFNLIDNAAKYGKGERAEVALSVEQRDDAVCFAVRDRGPGVPISHRRSIWAPFDRGAVAVSSNDVPGTGLGLPLARGLARDLGGDLVLDESVTDGACFVLRLPAG